jgi:hypothetical protein
MIPLTGTRSETHMRDDLALDAIELTPVQVSTIESLAQ